MKSHGTVILDFAWIRRHMTSCFISRNMKDEQAAQILYLIRRCITEFEQVHGKINLEEDLRD